MIEISRASQLPPLVAGRPLHATVQGALAALDKFQTPLLEAAVAPLSTHPTCAARRKALQKAVAAGLP